MKLSEQIPLSNVNNFTLVRVEKTPDYLFSELALMKFFSDLPGSELHEIKRELGGRPYTLMQATLGSYIGAGRGDSRYTATVKAIAECLERKFCDESFIKYPELFPKVFQTSNGFAVHFDQSLAKAGAIREALERHILQWTYFTKGWEGFQILDEKRDGSILLTKVISKYSCMGYHAGIVIARSELFRGVSLGYFCIHPNDINSAREVALWTHATHEAIDKINPLMRKIEESSNDSSQVSVDSIETETLWWFQNKIDLSGLSKSQSPVIALPEPCIQVVEDSLQDHWDLSFPFYGAFVLTNDLLPLIILGRIKDDTDSKLVQDILSRHGIDCITIPERNPIL